MYIYVVFNKHIYPDHTKCVLRLVKKTTNSFINLIVCIPMLSLTEKRIAITTTIDIVLLVPNIGQYYIN